MHRCRMFLLTSLALVVGAALAAGAAASTPTAADTPDFTLELVEHASSVTNVDQGEPGPSVGDLIIWGPNPLYDASGSDTGATTQGVCTAFTASADCLLLETVVFPDGSTLELQGVQPGQPVQSTRAIVAGTGRYLGATGWVTVNPTGDLSRWAKSFEIWLDD